MIALKKALSGTTGNKDIRHHRSSSNERPGIIP
jgi:hypothetical protein